ncbi:citrate/2-methylcitrate synthase [Rhodohalobacter sulfatireducens]|uniref:Citrate synthase n=1 Tax=Rhodohalobacter sulfatireducens TaxID=2911366 RepID=A0ABS9KB19_9BACT|nr:citrate/2-methylcitrate synthase [Rhodohalobacter sulfatireducens]MCG2588054.1 citrate synthase [Rhodohalobacter sulfatireducens]MDR9407360.1 citrate/2-methylcitrate synthase [Balneolaceae bacterium]
MAEQNLENIDLEQYPHINKGLAGIVAFSTTKSFIDGQTGDLIYAGYHIDTLAENATFEEVCFLLWNDRLPNQEELDELHNKLRSERQLPEPVIEYIKNTRKDAEPMAVLRTAVSMLADFQDDSNDTNHAIAVTAQIPTIIAAFDRVRNGKEVVSPLDEGSTAFNFLYMLNGEKPGQAAEKTMNLCLVLHAEHGMNASTFTCRTICATESDMFSAVTGAIGALKGPLHGGANTAVMNMLLNLKEQGENADPVKFTKEKLNKKEKMMGFGHRVYKTFDPRAVHLRKMSKELSEETGHEYLYEWSEAMVKTMKEEKNIDPNVDFFSASVYYSIGIQPDLYTCIFTMSRISGWTAHFFEQKANNRLIRPRALYVGEKNLDWVPVEDR